MLGTELAGAIARSRIFEDGPESDDETLASLEFNGGSVAGQGLGAFNAYGVSIRVEGGAQDGVGKAMLGGTIAVLKGKGAKGRRLNGSVGKSFAYGAQRGRLFVQGSADSRFCIRLSGADVVLAGEPEQDIDDSRGCIVDRANAKGFAFEYMTSGRAVVLGDLGPWACAGMTGGRVYVRHNAFGIDAEAIERRLGEGAKVELKDARRRGPARRRRPAHRLRRGAEGDRPGRGGGADPRAGRQRPGELPHGRPEQGPGGPEHLDRVALAESATGCRPDLRRPAGRPGRQALRDWRRGRPVRAAGGLAGASGRAEPDGSLGPVLGEPVGDRADVCRAGRRASARCRCGCAHSAASRSASTWSMRRSRASVRASISRTERSSFFSDLRTLLLDVVAGLDRSRRAPAQILAGGRGAVPPVPVAARLLLVEHLLDAEREPARFPRAAARGRPARHAEISGCRQRAAVSTGSGAALIRAEC